MVIGQRNQWSHHKLRITIFYLLWATTYIYIYSNCCLTSQHPNQRVLGVDCRYYLGSIHSEVYVHSFLVLWYSNLNSKFADLSRYIYKQSNQRGGTYSFWPIFTPFYLPAYFRLTFEWQPMPRSSFYGKFNDALSCLQFILDTVIYVA